MKCYVNDLEGFWNQIQNSKFALFACGPIISFRFNVIRGIRARNVTAAIALAYCSFA